MSANSFDYLEQFVDKHGEKGLRVLFIFKLLKQRVLKHIISETDEKNIKIHKNINQLCLQKAKELSLLDKTEVTEDDIKEILKSYKP